MFCDIEPKNSNHVFVCSIVVMRSSSIHGNFFSKFSVSVRMPFESMIWGKTREALSPFSYFHFSALTVCFFLLPFALYLFTFLSLPLSLSPRSTTSFTPIFFFQFLLP